MMMMMCSDSPLSSKPVKSASKDFDIRDLPNFIMITNTTTVSNSNKNPKSLKSSNLKKCYECTPLLRRSSSASSSTISTTTTTTKSSSTSSSSRSSSCSSTSSSSTLCLRCDQCGGTNQPRTFKSIQRCDTCHKTRCQDCVEFLVCDDADCTKSQCAECRDSAIVIDERSGGAENNHAIIEQCNECYESYCRQCIFQNYLKKFGHSCQLCPGYQKVVIPYEREIARRQSENLKREFDNLQRKADSLKKEMVDWMGQFDGSTPPPELVL